MSKLSEHYLVITSLGKDRPGIINAITHEVSRCGCNIEDSRFALFGDNFTFIMFLSGSWQAITEIEFILAKLGAELDLLIVMKRATAAERPPIDKMVRLQIEVQDSPGLIRQFTSLFDPKQTNIAELVSKTSIDKLSNCAKLHISLSVQITAQTNLTILKENIYTLCKKLKANYSIDIINLP